MPVLIGGGQITNRSANLDEIVEPIALMAEALRLAGVDSGSSRVVGAIERLVSVAGAWSYPDPAAIVARTVGATNAETALTHLGGDTPQTAIGELAALISSGDLDVAALVGAEAIYGRGKLRSVGQKMTTTSSDDDPASKVGLRLDMTDAIADQRGFDAPANVYPLFGDALRAHRNETHTENRDRIGCLWERFNRVAASNTNAWVRRPMTADEITTPSVTNRMVGWPYTKAMNSNWFVDQGAAVIICSVGAARRFGVGEDRWVFLHSATRGSATPKVSERDNYWSSPAVAETGKDALSAAGVGIDDIASFDLYSCFPSMPQLTLDALGLADDDSRPLTLTGGLTFFGGPFNNYVTHALLEMIHASRCGRGPIMVHANGGYATKEAFGIYGSTPPKGGFRSVDCQQRINRYPTRGFDSNFEGEAAIEAATVLHNREGPDRALIAALTPTGARAMGYSRDSDSMKTLTTTRCDGKSVTFRSNGEATLG